MNLEKLEELQDEAAVAYMAYTEVREKRKSAMLDAYNDIKKTENVDAETVFFHFGNFDAEQALLGAVSADSGNDKDRQEAVARLAAPFVWTAFAILDELKKEGKIKEGE